MKTELADVGVLVAIADEAHDDHDAALDWLRRTPSFATTPVTEMGLVRLLMNPRVVVPPATCTINQAVAALTSIRSLPAATFLPDESTLADPRAITSHVTGTKQVTDTHLLNLAMRAKYILVTFDARLRSSLPAAHRAHVRVLG